MEIFNLNVYSFSITVYLPSHEISQEIQIIKIFSTITQSYKILVFQFSF